jgi:hypothetical protein
LKRPKNNFDLKVMEFIAKKSDYLFSEKFLDFKKEKKEKDETLLDISSTRQNNNGKYFMSKLLQFIVLQY